MVLYLLLAQSVIWLDSEQSADQIFSLVRNVLPLGTIKIILPLLYEIEQLEVILMVEGWSPTEHNEHDDCH